MESQKGECDRQQRRHEAGEPRGEYDRAKHQRSDWLGLQQTRHKFRSNDCNSNRQDRHYVGVAPTLGAAAKVPRGQIPELWGLDACHLQVRPAAPTKAIRALWMKIGNLFQPGRP